MSRFIKLPGFFFEDELLFFHDLWINPFQVESFISLDISYTNDDGMNVEVNGSKIVTKSGVEYDVSLSPEDLIKVLQ
jgi:hypothetical protein